MAISISLNDLGLGPERLKPAAKAILGLGIDLGTTNSVAAIAQWLPDQPGLLQAETLEVQQPIPTQGIHVSDIVPSVVVVAEGTTWVGKGAWLLAAEGAARGLRERREVFARTKNDMGIDRLYRQAEEGFRTPADIGAHILRFLLRAAPEAPDRVIITVPASFQIPQRGETRSAAVLAGIDVTRLRLLDEPVAALVGHLAKGAPGVDVFEGRERSTLVFDMGGGTCDVAVMTVERRQGSLRIATRSVSRFHRLGGDDIDAAIVHEVLLPQLLGQHGMDGRSVKYEDKRNVFEPALRPLAKDLKVGLCKAVRYGRAFGHKDEDLAFSFDGRFEVKTKDRSLTFDRPTLSLAAFRQILQPFLDRNMLARLHREYWTAQSIFAPVDDAIERARLSPADIEVVFAAGGSSLVPFIEDAMRDYLPRCTWLAAEDDVERKTCVALGAAVCAAVEALTGRPLVTPIACEGIGLRTASGLSLMIPAGAALPYPPESRRSVRVYAPDDSRAKPLPLRVEVVGTEDRVIFASTWQLAPPVRAGEPLDVGFRLDGDQVLELRLTRPESPEQKDLSATVEAPLTHVLNPARREVEAERLERTLAEPGLPARRRRDLAVELADVLRDLGQREKAFAVLRAAQRLSERPDPGLLNLMALVATDLGDLEEAVRLFEQAAGASPDNGTPLFNMSLTLERLGRKDEALAAIVRALERHACGPYETQRGLLLQALRGEEAAQEAFERAGALWPPLSRMSDWELSWYRQWARERGDHAAATRADQERQRRRREEDRLRPSPEGLLPEASDITRSGG